MIRAITAADDAVVERVIRTVMPEFGAGGAGFAINDPEVSSMSTAYLRPRHAYFVLEQDGQVVGGAGVAPLAGAAEDVCELRKMYFLPIARGKGWGRSLLHHCLDEARRLGFRLCYLETLTGMDAAMQLYTEAGFLPLAAPMGSTGHFGCNRFYARDL